MPLVSMTHVRAVAAGAVILVGYLVLLGYRHDYAGHAMAGYAGTLGLLALVMLGRRRGDDLRWTVAAVVCLAIVLGAAAEATVFHGAVWDPVDFGNQSAGACLAGCVVAGQPTPGLVPSVALGAVAGAFLVAGFFLALG
jgi:hypothetical protein